MEKAGWGELHKQFLELKKKLRDEGLFRDIEKKELPSYPGRIGIATSDSGAAIEDIKDVLSRRFPVDILLSPTQVQGDGAERDIARSIRLLDERELDVIIVGRGGGSLEDLWCFNEEVVARAIYNADTPVVSAVGHEVDVTITDLVSDKRAATPSEAAELVVPSKDEISTRIKEFSSRIENQVDRYIERRQKIIESHRRFLQRGPDMVRDYMQTIDSYREDIDKSIQRGIKNRRDRTHELSKHLDSLSPLGILSRGYSVTKKDRDVVTSVTDVELGDDFEVRVTDGYIEGNVIDKAKRESN